jgi:hypothetical protein
MDIRLRTGNASYYIDKSDILYLKFPIYVKNIIKDNLKLFSTIFDTNDNDVANLLCAQFNSRYEKFDITPMDSVYDLYSNIDCAPGARCINGKCVPIR